MTTKASFGSFQLAILDALACMDENVHPEHALAFLAGHLRGAGYEIIAEAMQRACKRLNDGKAVK